MDLFFVLSEAFCNIPTWAVIAAVLCVLVLSAVLFAVFGSRKFYAVPAGAAVAFGTAILSARGAEEGLLFCGLSGGVAVLLCTLFLLPPRGRRKKREERVYERFVPEAGLPPPKVCCFEETVTAEEGGMRLGYVGELIEKLKACPLAPADRLELEVLSKTVDGCRGKTLGGEDLSRLNDCLASVLRLTARYRL